ncbi:MAG TPA: hypothetical protein VEK07_15315 [Polyangiaceae bacterium]|nr:hypothetical protein [Polyangiaceae bacterium]
MMASPDAGVAQLADGATLVELADGATVAPQPDAQAGADAGGLACGTSTPPSGSCAVTSALQPVAALPANGTSAGNACKNSSLPPAYGTNFSISDDPAGWGPNTTVMGWEGNWWPTFEYASGAFFARGVSTSTYKVVYGTLPDGAPSAGKTICGAMYSFGVATASGVPSPGAVSWTMAQGYLPAFTTSFTNNEATISITNFEDQVTIGGSAVGLVYSRVAVTNNGSAAQTVDPAPSAGLTALTNNSTTVAPGQTVDHDYVVAVDDFGSGQPLPSSAALAAVPSFDTAYAQMTSYWEGRLASIPTFTLPDVALPNTNLSNPGTQLENAFKANFIYTRMVQVGKAPFSAANNYAWLLNHDLPGILANRLALGDFQDAQNLLLAGRTSEQTSGAFPNYGANYYMDGWWKTPWPWALYLAKTGDTGFVQQYFDDTGSWGDSLYTLMHQIPSHLTAQGYLAASDDNDSEGVWLFDDYSAIVGLAAYKYIATQIGNATEATWADGQLSSLIQATNAGIQANQQANDFDYLPCEVDVPMSADRCGDNGADANWASAAFYGQNAWDSFLMGANLTGILGDPGQTDGLYDYGYGTLLKGAPPFPTMGGYPGYSTADNTGYAQGGLYGTKYRDLALTSYAWQIETTTGGPYAWWEANKVAPDGGDPWAGSHAAPQFGACPYAWPLAGQSLSLLDAIAAEGLSATASGGSFSYTRPLYVGRGIPDAWLAPGQTIAAANLTSSFEMSSCERSTYGVTIVVGASTPRVVTVTFCGVLPGGPVYVQLPIFGTVGVSGVTTGGVYDAATSTVTVNPGAMTVVIQLAG